MAASVHQVALAAVEVEVRISDPTMEGRISPLKRQSGRRVSGRTTAMTEDLGEVFEATTGPRSSATTARGRGTG